MSLLQNWRKKKQFYNLKVVQSITIIKKRCFFPSQFQPQGLLHESFGVFCPNDRLELLQLLRDEDVLMEWSKPLYMNFVHSEIAQELIRLYEDSGSVETVLGDVWAVEESTRQSYELILSGEEDAATDPDDDDVTSFFVVCL